MSLALENAKQHAALLDLLGYDLTITRPAVRSGTYDVTQSRVTGGAALTETVRGLFLAYRKADIDGVLVQRNDRVCIVASRYNGAALARAPQVGDQITGKGDAVTVRDVQTIEGGGSVVAYVLQVRA